MRAERPGSMWSWLPALAVLALAGGSGAAQELEVVSKQVAVGRNEALLELEFISGEPLEVALREGRFEVDGQDVGPASAELDAAWRFLLGQAVALEDGPLVRTLIDWSPPAELEGDALETATRIDQALEEALSAPVLPAPDAPGMGARVSERSVLAALLGRRERMLELAEALEDMRLADVQLHVAEEVTVPENTEVDATVIVVDGNLEVGGEVDGDVVVVGGSIRLHPGGTVTGDVRLVDSRLYDDGGEVLGEVVELDAAEASDDLDGRLREEIRREIESAYRDEDFGSSDFLAPLRYVGRGIAGVISTVLTAVVLGLIGGAVLHFGGNNLEIVAETARRSPARAAAVGLAGTFLTVPVWLLGALALTVTIVGIPVMLLWLPLFPLAVVLAAGLGYYAVAHNVGSWIARRDYASFRWVRLSNPYTLVAGGVMGLMAAFLVANALEIGGPWLGFLQGIILALGIVATVLAVLVGFGSVLITRAGRRPQYYPGGVIFDDAWDADLGSAESSASSWTAPASSQDEAGSDPTSPDTPGGEGSETR